MMKNFFGFAAAFIFTFPGLSLTVCAQTVNAKQAVTVEGLLASGGNGGFKAAAYSPDGSLVLLEDMHDGVRVLKANAAASNVVAQAYTGSAGDAGVAMCVDAAGNVYVAGTSTSGTLRGTSGAVYPAPADLSTNSFLAKYDANLDLVFLTFLGSGRTSATSVAATPDAVFVTGLTYNAAFPVTPAGVQQAPAAGSSQNGFVERFSTDGTTLSYATYLTGYGGDTTPASLAADASDDAYVAGLTSANGFPTTAALQPDILGTTSGFLSKLSPAGNGFVFSTFIAGGGLTSVSVDAASGTLLGAGNVSLGQFPVMSVPGPLATTSYQVLLRLSEDGQTVMSSLALVPGTDSFATPGPGGTAWVSGSLTIPLFPGVAQPDYPAGDAFLLHITAGGAVDQTLRFGGLPVNESAYASLSTVPAAPAVSADGTTAALPATVMAAVSSSLSATERFDLPLAGAPNSLLPNTVRDVAVTCASGQCSGTGGLLGVVETSSAEASLGLSSDNSPNIVLRNLGSANASGVVVTAAGFSVVSDCGSTLEPSNQCAAALTGAGPGTVTASAANAATVSAALPANSVAPDALALSTDELDFGIATSLSPVSRVLQVTNLTGSSQSFKAAADNKMATSYTFSASATTCGSGGTAGSYTIAGSASCELTFTLTASASSSGDGAARVSWLVGTRDVVLTGFAQGAALSASATEVDFGVQFSGTGALRVPRYLFVSNNSATAVAHAAVSLPPSSPFTALDECPSVLEPQSVCRITLTYNSAVAPSDDATTLTLDDGLSVLVMGETRQPAGVTGSTSDPNIMVSPTSLSFASAVVVTGVSGTAQTVTVQNTGSSAAPLAIAVSGDFTIINGCPAILAGGAACTVQVSFAPSGPGTRQGVLSVTGGTGFAPTYVTLAGIGTAILPANNGTLTLGSTYIGEPLVVWYKVQQGLTSLTATTGSGSFGVAIVDGSSNVPASLPTSSFAQMATSTCSDCWLGVQFLVGVAGTQSTTLSLRSAAAGNPYVLTVTATALPVSGLVLSPLSQDFGPVPVDSTSAAMTFTLTDLLAGSSGVQIQSVSATGDFSVQAAASSGTDCASTVAPTGSCTLEVTFVPTATGERTGLLTVTTSGGTATAQLSGYGEPDPGVALQPTAVVFNDVAGAAATQQTVTLTDTSGASEVVGTPSVSGAGFGVSSNCGTLAASAACTLSVSFQPQSSPASGALLIPVTTTVNGQTAMTVYTVPLSATYTALAAGLTISPGETNFGSVNTSTLGFTQQFTLFNFSPKTLEVQLSLPRQFPLADPGACATLAPGSSCVFSVSFVPAINGEATGTVTATGTPTDGTATLQAIAYMLGYGVGSGSLAISGNLIPNTPLSFGQVNSGQTAQHVLTVTNTGTTTVTIRRATSEPPFFSTSTCVTALAPNGSCSVTLTYEPVDEIAMGTTAGARNDTGQLVVESDAANSPVSLALTGIVLPLVTSSPASSSVLATFALSESALTFANTTVGNSSAAQNVTLTNTGNQTLQVAGTFAPQDFAASTTCATLLAGQTCSITVMFTPTTATTTAVRTGTLEINSNGAVSLEAVTLLGVSSAAPLVLNPTALNFGTINVRASSPLSFTVTNTTAAPVTFEGVSATGDYSVARGTCPANGATLAAGATCQVVVTFAPTAAGTRTGVVSVATDATQLPLTVSLTGVGAAAALTVSPSALAFGAIAVGSPANLTLTLLNTGTATVTGIATTVAGPNAAEFAVTVPCPLTQLAPNQGCSVTVRFTPSVTGPEAATLSITSSDPGSPLVVPLTGSGAPAGGFVLTVDGGNAATVTVASGSPAVYALTVTPTSGFNGTVALTCTPVIAGQYASCSLLSSTLSLASGAQSSTATLNTITSLAGRVLEVAAMLLVLPLAGRRRRRFAGGMMAAGVLAALALAGGCGGSASGGGGSTNVRYTPAGTYQYTVTASSTSGPTVSQTVTLNLIVQ
jgi:hypothetical protein